MDAATRTAERRLSMKIEITYSNGEKYTAFLANETHENVVACLLDDISVSVSHSIDAEKSPTSEQLVQEEEKK